MRKIKKSSLRATNGSVAIQKKELYHNVGALHLLVITVILLFTSYPAHAEDRLACEMRKQKIIKQVIDSNVCHEDSDCSYVDVKDCDNGCATLPIYKHMESRLELALRDYHASCIDGCQVSCRKFLQGKCIRGKCQSEYRDWNYITKQKK